jgi:hypothetical protein
VQLPSRRSFDTFTASDHPPSPYMPLAFSNLPVWRNIVARTLVFYLVMGTLFWWMQDTLPAATGVFAGSRHSRATWARCQPAPFPAIATIIACDVS